MPLPDFCRGSQKSRLLFWEYSRSLDRGFLSVFKFADNGSITQNLTTSGNYTVHSDCTGSISFTSGDAATVTFNTVIIGGWTEVFCIQTNSGTVANLDARKQ